VSGEFVFRPRQGRRRVQLNLTSLIDVLFLLLIFFMLTSTFRRTGEMQLDLPASTTSEPDVGSEGHAFIEVVMQADGAVTVNGEAVSPEDAPKRLRELHRADPKRQVRLKAAADARHADVVRLYDLFREVGFSGFSLGTEIAPPDASSKGQAAEPGKGQK
jgi:biopolymer transport protein ExbD